MCIWFARITKWFIHIFISISLIFRTVCIVEIRWTKYKRFSNIFYLFSKKQFLVHNIDSIWLFRFPLVFRSIATPTKYTSNMCINLNVNENKCGVSMPIKLNENYFEIYISVCKNFFKVSNWVKKLHVLYSIFCY